MIISVMDGIERLHPTRGMWAPGSVRYDAGLHAFACMVPSPPRELRTYPTSKSNTQSEHLQHAPGFVDGAHAAQGRKMPRFQAQDGHKRCEGLQMRHSMTSVRHSHPGISGQLQHAPCQHNSPSSSPSPPLGHCCCLASIIHACAAARCGLDSAPQPGQAGLARL
jgi:hypothetical protein